MVGRVADQEIGEFDIPGLADEISRRAALLEVRAVSPRGRTTRKSCAIC